jgi:chromosomal replication initiator protein
MDHYQSLWQRTLAEFELTQSVAVIKTYFSRTVFIDGSDGELLIGCPNNMVISQIDHKYRPKLEEIASRLNKSDIDIRFIVQKVEQSQDDSPLFDVQPDADIPSSQTAAAPAAATEATTPNTSTPISFLNPHYIFEEFVVGNSNRVAHAAAMAISERPGQVYNPFFLYGGTGVGKTHLVQAIGNALLAKKPTPKVLYFSIERFTNDFIESLRFRNTNEFKKKYRTADVLIVDDIQFISGKESTQEEFFHTFNELQASGRQIILCSDRPPREIASLADRLTSRFEGGLTVDISPPDFETRSAIIRAKADRLGLAITADIADYLSSLAAENIRAIEGMMLKLQSLALSTNQPLSIELVKTLFAHQAPAPASRQPNPNDILKVICETYGVTLKEITGKKRTKNLVSPRQMAMYLLRQDIGLNLQSIGQLLGGRDHTTVMHGIEKISKLAQTDDQIRSTLTALRQSFLR